ncbi:MAG: MarR family EPS-associated transcriptional regulator [Spirochaetia bacterium]|nr:MarR family EPS-associated transcriptional regulator [Spirochaetia bacterium]
MNSHLKESQLKALQLLESNPQLSQRDLSKNLGVSLGKVNYIIKALLEKGYIKASNFKNSKNKWAYMYILTPHGIETKANVARQFLSRKMKEYEELKRYVSGNE